MKNHFKSTLNRIAADRWISGLFIANIVMAIIVIITIALSIQPNETQVITQYSSFGIASFYRDQWYALWMYAVLEIIVVIGHGALALKLLQLDRKSIAQALLWLTLGISIIILLYARSIIKIAALG